MTSTPDDSGEAPNRWESSSSWGNSQLSMERLGLYTLRPRLQVSVLEWLVSTNSVNTLRAVTIDWPTAYGMEITKRVFTSLLVLDEVTLSANGNTGLEYCTCRMLMWSSRS
jgi:hypothetical protein